MHIPEKSLELYSGWSKVPAMSCGWLGGPNDLYPMGGTPPEFIQMLREAPLVHRYRGTHQCELCGKERGVGEYWVVTRSGNYYVLPQMVLHYIESHGYCPPLELTSDFDRALNSDEVSALSRPPTDQELQEKREASEKRFASCMEEGDKKRAQEIAAAEDQRVFQEIGKMFDGIK